MAWFGKLVVGQATHGSSSNLRQRRIVDDRAERAGGKNINLLCVSFLRWHDGRTKAADGLPNRLIFYISHDELAPAS